MTADDVLNNDPQFYREYGRVIEKLEDLALMRKHRTWMTTCEWIYGTSGTGASEYSFKDYNPDTHYIWTDDRGWWDGYEGQETVIINEFRTNIIW